MSGQPKVIEQKQVQNNAPWKGAQPYFADLYKRADAAMKATNNNPFTGDFVAGPTDTQRQGLSLLKDAALRPQATVAAAPDNSVIRNYATKSLEGGFLPSANFDYKANPFLQQVISGAIDPVRRQLTEQILPNISDRAIAEGAYGGAGQDIAQGQVVDEFGRTAANIGAKISSEDYTNQMSLWAQQRAQERQLMQGAAGILGGINASDWNTQNAVLQDQERMRLSPGQDLITLGGLEQGWNQLGLDNAVQRDAAMRAAPWYGLGEMGNILTQGGFRTTNTSGSSTNPNYESPMMAAMKMAMGGGAAVAGMGGQGGFGLWGRKAA